MTRVFPSGSALPKYFFATDRVITREWSSRKGRLRLPSTRGKSNRVKKSGSTKADEDSRKDDRVSGDVDDRVSGEVAGPDVVNSFSQRGRMRTAPATPGTDWREKTARGPGAPSQIWAEAPLPTCESI